MDRDVRFMGHDAPIGRRDVSRRENAAVEGATDYWLIEYPSMADKTRSSILTGVAKLSGSI